jgi:hypothetical protein
VNHEELLDAISVQILHAPPFALGGYPRFLHALGAVVQLHKPEQEIGGGCDENGEELWVCTHCPDGDGFQDYPCPTIRAIEEGIQL